MARVPVLPLSKLSSARQTSGKPSEERIKPKRRSERQNCRELHKSWAELRNQPQPQRGSGHSVRNELKRTAVKYAYELSSPTLTGSERRWVNVLADFERTLRRKRGGGCGCARCKFHWEILRLRFCANRHRNPRGWDIREGEQLFVKFCEILAQATLATPPTHGSRLRGDTHVGSPIYCRASSPRGGAEGA